MKYQEFTVTWRGEFPLDMLRYDSCFPANQQAVSAITASITGRATGPLRRTAQIARYVRHRAIQPTTDRWSSFRATVSDVRTS